MQTRISLHQLRWLVAGLLILAVAAEVLAHSLPLPERMSTPGSTVVLYDDGSVASAFLAPDDRWRIPASVDRVDPDYVSALIALEDSRFYVHPGFDPIALSRAAAGNLWAGHVESGASTLTMQLVRMVEPRPRTIRSKVVEIGRALQIERQLTKDEVLADYLTFLPFGKNLEGVEAASLAYFGHGPEDLSANEICVLLAVPQDPNGRYPSEAHEPTLRAARDHVAEKLLAVGALPSDTRSAEELLAEIRETPVPTSIDPLPHDAPHAARWLVRRMPGTVRIPSSLDRDAQRIAERTLAGVREERDREGIHNAAIVVVDHRTGAVRAMVGGFDFWDDVHGGQISAFDVPRSPGSALKPFIYASAIDKGLVLPDQLVPDIPIRFGDYTPQNFDGQWSGFVRAEDALSRSLNIPFVDLLQKVGTEPFLGDLRALGATHLNPEPGHYGLSVAAGGIELTPIEMAGLYVALAEDGRPRTLGFRAGDAVQEGPQVLTPGSAWLTRRALRLRDRPDFPSRRSYADLPPTIAWKTGTSFGWRDAWAIGMGPRYVVVVWMGNLDNTGTPTLVGAESSGPVMFDVMDGLGEDRVGADDQAPAELVPVQVCALSGKLASEACPHRKTVLARAPRVPTATCDLHVHIEVDEATGLAVRPGCREGKTTKIETYVEWPSSVRRYLGDAMRAQVAAPPLDPSCEAVAHRAPRILSPGQSDIILLVPGLDPTSQDVPFEADADDPDAELAWFVDGKLIGRAPADERVWWTPEPGEHVLLVMDASGATARQALIVRG